MTSSVDRSDERAGDGADGSNSTGRRLGQFLLIALLLAAAGGGSWWALQRTGPSTAAPVEQPPARVTVAAPVRRELVEWDEFTGRFEAVERVEVRARVGGYLAATHFADGQMVEQDQPLFTIDQRPFTNAVTEAEGALVAAQAALDQARQNEDRQGRLRETNSAAFQRAAYEDLVTARLAAAGQVDRTRAQLEAARLNLDFTTVRAPVAGRVSSRRADVGNLIGDVTLLTTIVSLDPIHFVFDMSESDFLAYQRAVAGGTLPSTRDRGTIAAVNLEDETDWRREARMNFVDNEVDQGAGTVRARVVLPNTDLLIAPGQFGRVRIPGTPLYTAVLVPESAIVTQQSQRLVMLVDAANRILQRPVRVGPREGGLRIIRRGLDGTERLVINGLMNAEPGAEVAPETGRIEGVHSMPTS